MSSKYTVIATHSIPQLGESASSQRIEMSTYFHETLRTTCWRIVIWSDGMKELVQEYAVWCLARDRYLELVTNAIDSLEG